MISVVLVGRNDNYGGDFQNRLFATVCHNVLAFEKAGINYEIIFVEWNPVTLKPLLSKKLVRRFPRARCFVVGRDVHRHICQNRNITLYEYHAKNVGAKRAAGQWLILMNPDDFLGQEIIDFLARGDFDKEMVCRCGWINIVDPRDVDNPALTDNTLDDVPPFLQHSGDFVFCSRELFERVGGYREDLPFTNSHKDSIFCLSAYDLTHKVVKNGNVYHLKHARTKGRKRRIKYDPFKVPRTRQPSFGLADVTLEEEVVDRVIRLRLREPLRRAARFKRLPMPVVPEAYRVQPVDK